MGSAIADLFAARIAAAHAAHPDRPALIGVGGAQGSGKSFQCRAFAKAHPGVAHFSLDDVYRTRAERAAMSGDHKLLLTRGPPGSHDLALAAATINALTEAAPEAQKPLPRFDKARDDRAPQANWPRFNGQPDAILVDGWCMGATDFPAASPPLTALESEDDPDGVWRARMHAALTGEYAGFFSRFDEIIYLQAPNFEIVRRWRGQQEEAMLERAMTHAEAAALDRFIMHYERVTRAMLAGALRADWIVRLDEQRNVIAIEER